MEIYGQNAERVNLISGKIKSFFDISNKIKTSGFFMIRESKDIDSMIEWLGEAEQANLMFSCANIGLFFHHTEFYDLWDKIFDIARDNNLTILATTQSIDCIKAFNEVQNASELPSAYFRIGESQRDSNKGEVIATKFDNIRLFENLKNGVEVR